MNIVTVFSPDWLKYVQIEMFALLSNNKVDKVYLLSDGEQDLSEIDKIFERFHANYVYIDMAEAATMLNNVNVDSRFTKYTLYRLLLPYVVPEKKVLYIDADAIVVDRISDFYSIEIDTMAGCEDIGIARCHKTNIGMTEDSPYLNAGVVLLNLENVGKLADKWVQMANATRYIGHDQDIWNITMHKHSKIMPNDYNSSLSTGFSENIKVCHYAGEKPWNNKNVPHYDIWEEWSNKYACVFRN